MVSFAIASGMMNTQPAWRLGAFAIWSVALIYFILPTVHHAKALYDCISVHGMAVSGTALRANTTSNSEGAITQAAVAFLALLARCTTRIYRPVRPNDLHGLDLR